MTCLTHLDLDVNDILKQLKNKLQGVDKMDILVHVPDHLLARVDEKVRNKEFSSRCQFITKAVRWYLELLEERRRDVDEAATSIHFEQGQTVMNET